MNRLKELRETNGWSAMELSRRTGISDSTISKLEKGYRDISKNHIKPLCKAFGVTTDYLLGLDEEFVEEENVTNEKEVDDQVVRGMGLVLIDKIIDLVEDGEEYKLGLLLRYMHLL